MFNIYAQIQKELEDFQTNKVHIAGTKNKGDTIRYLEKQNGGYNFSQWETLNLIDLYYNSKFESGDTDSEGQQKVFLNVCAFRSDVASKMVDLDTKNFTFIPEESASKWPAFFMAKEFRVWAKENYFGELLNDVVENYPKYGTVVLKKVGKTLERVPLKNLRNQQDAKDLRSARYVVEVHEDMSLEDMQAMEGWDTSNVSMKFGETATVYERYGRVPAKFYNKAKGIDEEVDENESYDCLVISTLAQKKKGETPDGSVLFIEKIDERPYLEVHWKKQDGRWLGIGEIENQFENQVSRNMIANLRRRALMWSAKKVFQSPDETVAKNLVRDVKDGEVLRIAPNGNITQVDMSTHSSSDFSVAEQVWEKNSDQKSFTYEVATGEALPSGTPFRLGVLLSGATKSHFDFKRQKLGLFLKRVITDFVLPEFAKDTNKEHVIALFDSEEGIEILKSIKAEHESNEHIKNTLLEGKVPDVDAIKALVNQEVSKLDTLFVTIPQDFYKNAKYNITLTVTGEEIDTHAQIETLTNLYQTMVQKQDPRADKVLERIIALTGSNTGLLSGPSTAPQPQGMQNAQPTATAPNMANLLAAAGSGNGVSAQ